MSTAERYDSKKYGLTRLSDSGLSIAAPTEDIRGRKVVDSDSEEVGEVDDLFIDEAEHKVRFLLMASGGFLGMGKSKVLVPVDAVKRVTKESVYLDRERTRMTGAPTFDPELTEKPDWDTAYTYYGYTPYWRPGYMYPVFPYF